MAIDDPTRRRHESGHTGHATLERALRHAVTGEVRFDTDSRALYATDASNYRQVLIGVVIPKTLDDAIATVNICRQFGAPLLSRGAGTSLAGQCCNVAVIIDFSKYLNRVVSVDSEKRIGRVQPGVILDDLRDAAEEHQLTFGPDPATHNHCTFGGMIGNNSCGTHSIMAGMTADNIESLDIITYDGLRMTVGPTSDEELARIIAAGGRRGEIYAGLRDLRDRYADLVRERFPKIPRRVSGYGLEQLLPENGFSVARALVGTEGTCVTVLGADVRLVNSPQIRSLLVLGYPDIYQAADDVPEIMTHKPIALEGFDKGLVRAMKRKNLDPQDLTLLPDGGGWLLVEFGSDRKQDTDDQAHALMDALRKKDNPPSMRYFDDPDDEAQVWEIREAALGATAHVPGEPNSWPGWEDAAVPPEREGDYLREYRQLLEKYGYLCDIYGHLGQGCIHGRVTFDLETAAGIRAFRSFIDKAADLVVSYGGSLSGEHRDGQARAAMLAKMYGEELVQAFGEFKAIWDPGNNMNPGKVVDPWQPEQNLRLGTDYRPQPLPPNAHFQFPDDNGSFAEATLRCVGVGKCRRLEGGTMCPSFMVTREEKDTTRGRARLLFEMLQGDPLEDGWRNEDVKDALDLCLACKGCKGDCPVNVDMATYKAEFLSHYYAGRLRPVTAYSIGLISWWARFAAHMPGVANMATRTPGLRTLAKRIAGIAPERSVPGFAPQTFKAWFRGRPPRNPDGERVLLWPDTFNNHFHPETAKAAVEVLEAAGFHVVVPEPWLCCGRPLYDYGMLDLAEKLLRDILETLRPEIEAGTPLVGLEPSCLAVFRDEMRNLFPNDEDAKRLYRQSYLLSEFLEKRAPDFQVPRLDRKAIVQGHCHHQAVMRMTDEEAVLGKMHLDYEVLDSGCCGMAGGFGFERGDHYDVSIKAGERVLLPAVRDAAGDTVIIADGFSCREQISQQTDRHALHLAQVLQMAMTAGPEGPRDGSPEAGYIGKPARPGWRTLAAGATTIGMAGALWAARHTSREG